MLRQIALACLCIVILSWPRILALPTNPSTRYRPVVHGNVSTILNWLLSDYDRLVRPTMTEDSPTMVTVNLYIRSMEPINAQEMTYAFDCYFRQEWTDERLRFSLDDDTTEAVLSLSAKFLDNIWRPDTYVLNGKFSYLHMITQPNRLLRLNGNGSILLSSRITIKADCRMRLYDFPMDVQYCPLLIGSFGYTSKELVYQWSKKKEGAIALAPDIKFSQFDLEHISTRIATSAEVPLRRNFSILKAVFTLKRHLGFFLIQTYIPSILLVSLSWVAFWLNREATADRVSLGSTTILNLALLLIDQREDLPQVAFPTAIDWYIIWCFLFVFGSVLEFALVHFYTKFGSGEHSFLVWVDHLKTDAGMRKLSQRMMGMSPESPEGTSEPSGQSRCSRMEPMGGAGSPQMGDRLGPFQNLNYEQLCARLRRLSSPQAKYSFDSAMLLARDHPELLVNSVSDIDRICRLLFPLLFAVFNGFYWYKYSADWYL